MLENRSIFYDCLIATQSRIRSLNLAGFDDNSIVVRKLPLDRRLVKPSEVSQVLGGIALPAIIITPSTERMPANEGLLGLDDVTYGVLITIVQSDNQEATLEEGLSDWLYAREKIARAFRQQPRLDGASTIINGSIEPREVVNQAAWSNNLLVQALLYRPVSREPMLAGV